MTGGVLVGRRGGKVAGIQEFDSNILEEPGRYDGGFKGVVGNAWS